MRNQKNKLQGLNTSGCRPKLGFGRLNGSFPPKLHKTHSRGKPATSYCSKWGVTWLRTWNDNHGQWDSTVSIQRELKATTLQKVKVIKEVSTDRSTDKYTKYPKFAIKLRPRQDIKVISYKRYPRFLHQFSPRRSKKRDTHTEYLKFKVNPGSRFKSNSSNLNTNSHKIKLGFGRFNGSFPPKLHKTHTSGKPATPYCSKWGVTWL